MHPYRRHGRSEARVLYWFRTPPYLKVGRAPLDDEAKRLLEESHPEVAFDWNKILREPPQQLPETEAVRRRERRESRDARRKRKRTVEDRVDSISTETAQLPESPADDEQEAAAGEDVDLRMPEDEQVTTSRIGSATSELLGVEGAARLHNRYVVLMQRISRLHDEEKREELRRQAEGLNPDAWETVEVARAALETYEARYEALRAQVGGGRRHRRRRRT
ncbi:MAG TPA: hypothetical protein VK886_15750 [Vicinamibacterales bacterium]|nr:hypothetical protein [Vicinamibacterales bacterium]